MAHMNRKIIIALWTKQAKISVGSMHDSTDCLKKIVAQGRSPLYTQVGQIMTNEVILYALSFSFYLMQSSIYILWLLTHMITYNRMTW
jgi:hypothetical protein